MAKALRAWLGRLGVKTLFIEPGSPWESGYCESFHSKLCDEFLNREILYSLKEAQILIERRRRPCNPLRPYGARKCWSPPSSGLAEAWATAHRTGASRWKNNES